MIFSCLLLSLGIIMATTGDVTSDTNRNKKQLKLPFTPASANVRPDTVSVMSVPRYDLCGPSQTSASSRLALSVTDLVEQPGPSVSPPTSHSTPAKKPRSKPISRVCPEARVRQYPDELYASDGVLFCKYCCHSVDYVRIDTIKDHLRCANHMKNKDKYMKSKSVNSAKKQATVLTMYKSRDLRCEFILDFIKLCSLADIPLDKVEKMRPFMKKYCQQGGAIPQAPTLRTIYLPRLYEEHTAALKMLLKDKIVAIIADETTDIRDKSILNVLAKVNVDANC
jgi:hypothetical protein